MTSSENRPELLAPAGDWEAMRAAVANGADAVYFGLPLFNARHRATNFAPDDLPRIMRFLHDRNVKGFITLNTLIFSDELEQVVDYVQLIAGCGVDAVIVQDLGVARLIRELVPSLHIHGSTQMTLTEPRGIRFIQESLGIERVVLARELSLEEIRKLVPQTTMPVEVFVHGALCVAYSGQCLTSEALGGRSANRGQCAQACRLPYQMLVDGKEHDLGDRAYLLSPQDLAAYDLMDELVAAGVISFKIEGRLKSSHYVASTTQTYRKALDSVAEKREFELSRREERHLAQTFSRGFTPGFLEGNDHQRLVQGRFPKSRGVRLGKLFAVRGNRAVVELFEADEGQIKPGDGVVFDLGKPEEQEPGGRVWEFRTSREGRNRVKLTFENLDLEAIPLGTTIWKTDDPALRKELEQSYAGDEIHHRLLVAMHLFGELGGRLQLQLHLQGDSVSAEWAGPLEAARKQPTSREEIREQFSRLGETPFALGELTLSIPENVMLPRSVLNQLRRTATELLLTRRREREVHAIANPNALHDLRRAIPQTQPAEGIELTVLVRTMEQLDAVLNWRSPEGSRVARVYCDFEDTRRYRDAVSRAKAKNFPIVLATLRILKPGEEGFLKPILNSEPDGVLIRNLGSMAFFQKEAPRLKRYADFSLNVANELTANLLHGEGFETLVPSYDLNWEQLASLVKRSPANWYEPVIHQHMPMFHMEHCVFAAFLSTGKDHRDCGRPCDRHRVELRDRVGAEFPVTPDAGCRNTVFNSVPQSAVEYLERMRTLGLSRFRVDLLRETPEDLSRLLSNYWQVLSGCVEGRDLWSSLRALNQLGVTRGTLQLIGS
jgi:putative protease